MAISANRLKVTVVSHSTWDHPPDLCHVIEMPDKKIPEALRDVFRSWCCGQSVVIQGPTGGGKTSLVLEIVQHCQKVSPHKKVLLLESRKAIAEQQLERFSIELGSEWADCRGTSAFSHVKELEDVGVVISTYQAFSAQYRHMDLSCFEWVVFDECHFFLGDALFNAQLDLLFWKLPSLFKHAHRLYLSATPKAVLPDICRAEKHQLQHCGICAHSLCKHSGKMLLYRFPDHYESVRLFYYREIAEIVHLVKDNPDDKFLVFVAKREPDTGTKVSSYLNAFKTEKISACYLDSGLKNTAVWKKVCSSGDFDSQVLVSTSVLDCGISLHNPSLRHIVVETFDEIEFLQMIGRRRLDCDEQINVYIRAVDSGTVKRRLASVNEQLSFISSCHQTIKTKGSDTLIYKGWVDESNNRQYMHLLNYLGDGAVYPKLTAHHQLLWQKRTFLSLLSNSKDLDDGSALPRLALGWLNRSGEYDPSNWLEHRLKESCKARLTVLLDGCLDAALSKAEYSTLTREILSIISLIHKFPHDTKEGICRKPATVNSRFEFIGLPYEASMIKKGNHPPKYFFTRKERG